VIIGLALISGPLLCVSAAAAAAMQWLPARTS